MACTAAERIGIAAMWRFFSCYRPKLRSLIDIMANIHLIGGEKGGVGKSLVAHVLAQYFIDREIPFVAFDTDRSHGALMRFYAGYASPVVVDNYESLDACAFRPCRSSISRDAGRAVHRMPVGE